MKGCMKGERKRQVNKKCGKNCYNRLDAMLALSKIKNKCNNKRKECRKYWCDICGAFHLTKIKKYK